MAVGTCWGLGGPLAKGLAAGGWVLSSGLALAQAGPGGVVHALRRLLSPIPGGHGPHGRSYAEAALEGAGFSGTRLCRVMSFSPSGCAPSDPHVQLLAPLCTHHRYSVSTHPVQAMFPEPR